MNQNDLIDIRRLLHQNAELSCQEAKTARLVQNILQNAHPDAIVNNIAGNGIAAVFNGKGDGQTVLFRCELDALTIPESIQTPHGSTNDGVSHKCGHDGHMAIMLGLAHRLSENPPDKGQVVLLFQPAEETGEGAQLVIDDETFQKHVPQPDYVFALHNLPGYPLGEIVVRDDVFASASIGMIVDLEGATSHAAEPQEGRSPAMALSQIIQGLSAAPQFYTALHEACQVTIIHAHLGEIAFGTSPGYGQVSATLRSHSTDVLEKIKQVCVRIVENIAKAYELDYSIQWREEFLATVNQKRAVEIIKASAGECKFAITEPNTPFPWSEDFGRFMNMYKGALFGLGAGKNQPALHHPDYDFPDELIETGVNIFEAILHRTVKEDG